LPFTKEEVSEHLLQLLKKNDMKEDGKVYLQATRGTVTRDHAFPTADTVANFHAYVETQARNIELLENGAKTITQPDTRWAYCHIKSLNLLPNVLAKQAAREANCFESILHIDGAITEASSSNVYLVKNGNIYTYPATERILKGCVRMLVE